MACGSLTVPAIFCGRGGRRARAGVAWNDAILDCRSSICWASGLWVLAAREKLRAGVDFSGGAAKIWLSSLVRGIDAISAIGGLSRAAEWDGVQNEA